MNEALAALYQGVILEHHERPRNRGPLDGANAEARLDNPLCGDRVTVRLLTAGEGGGRRIEGVRFEGDGCALSLASASLLTLAVEGRTAEEALALRAQVNRLLSRDEAEAAEADRALLGELVALEGARRFPARRRCALLAWDVLARALGAP